MFFIAHRGNIDGPNKEMENRPEYISSALEKGFDVEIDLWIKDEKLFLGHDEPQYNINSQWLTDRKNNLWIHCKNFNSFNFLSIRDDNTYKFFWHQEDSYTLTSNLMIWTYPNHSLSNRSIAVMPENTEYTLDQLRNCAGICSDLIENYRTLI